MKHSTIKALENLKRQKDEIIEIEDLSEYYKDIFGEDVEPQPPDESRDKK
ncbi:MAG: hypothetical protein IKJ06_02095 [Clostridia bacterium]|jgi:hypothetical protein|nr:hypothetical protein [Clostridia bacterium]